MIAPADSATLLPHTLRSPSLYIMAPSKPKPPTEPFNEDRVGDDARVARRPHRGFHRFRNGALNMKPKGKDERKMLVIQATFRLIADKH